MDVENNSLINRLNSHIEDYSSVLDMVDTIFIVIDENYVIRLINDKVCSVLGYEKNEVIGKYPADFVSPDNKDRINAQLEKQFSGNLNSVNYTEFPFITKNGQEKIIRWHNTFLRDNNGKIIYALKSGEDITEKKKKEKVQTTIARILSASNSEVNIDELFKFIHSSIKELMPAGNFYIALFEKENNQIRFPYFIDQYDKVAPTKRFEKGLTEYVIRTGKSLLVNEDVSRDLEREGEVVLLGAPSKIWLGVPLTIQDHIIGVLVVQDYEDENTYGEKEKDILEMISYPTSRAIERKLLEREREDLISKLKKLNESKDSLFSLISHDLRSPFNSLLGFSEILATEYETLTREEIKEYLNVIYDTSKNLYGMTNNLLQFSRFQMGRIDFNPAKLDIKAMLIRALQLLRGNTIKKQINIISSVPDGIKVNADEDMLNSILQNLISNAVKFTRKGGDIYISVNKITGQNNINMLQVHIRDTGVGLNSELIGQLFKDHVQSSPGTEKEYGSGLGLLLVKEFVEKNGGEISVKSVLNEGSTFSFTLPLFH
jgi:PAS domain S-box-containing protein